MECRRSSRKKVTKFDVRDLLNKSRKSHKIQIEARIDAASCRDNVEKSPSALEDKQKAFMEKSAIFRRYSISEQQNKTATAVPIRAMLVTNDATSVDGGIDCDASGDDTGSIGIVRRLSRTQEIFNASMMKSKQNSSLIVTQMESVSCSSSSATTTSHYVTATTHSAKKKSTPKAAVAVTPPAAVTKTVDGVVVVQRRRGRPPKIKPIQPLQITAAADFVATPLATESNEPSGTVQNLHELFVPIDDNGRVMQSKFERIDNKTATTTTFCDNQFTTSSPTTHCTEKEESLVKEKMATKAPAEEVTYFDSSIAVFDDVEVANDDKKPITDIIVDSSEIVFSGIEEVVVEMTTADCMQTTDVVVTGIGRQSEDVRSADKSESGAGNTMELNASCSGSKAFREAGELRVKLKRLSIPVEQLDDRAADVIAFNQTAEAEKNGSEQCTHTADIAAEMENENSTGALEATSVSGAAVLQEVKAVKGAAPTVVSANPIPLEAIKEIQGPSSNLKEIPIADESSIALTPIACNKQSITLPLKKQVSKLKHYGEITAGLTEASVDGAVDAGNVSTLVPESSFMRNVRVETRTLLDILRTVESNKIGQQNVSAKAQSHTAELPVSIDDGQGQCNDISTRQCQNEKDSRHPDCISNLSASNDSTFLGTATAPKESTSCRETFEDCANTNKDISSDGKNTDRVKTADMASSETTKDLIEVEVRKEAPKPPPKKRISKLQAQSRDEVEVERGSERVAKVTPMTTDSLGQHDVKNSSSSISTLSLLPTKGTEKKKFLEAEDNAAMEQSKQCDDKTAKKRRHKKIKEAFAAALLDVKVQSQMDVMRKAEEINEHQTIINVSATSIEAVEKREESEQKDLDAQSLATATGSALVAEDITNQKSSSTLLAKDHEKECHDEDETHLDPLKDIEKFIEAGVNLLNRNYEHASDGENGEDAEASVAKNAKPIAEEDETRKTPPTYDDVEQQGSGRSHTIIGSATADGVVERAEMPSSPLPDMEQSMSNELPFNLYETPADTPVATPTATPPPKSPVRVEDLHSSNTVQSDETALRRSHRIKQITKMPKALVGRGLVRDKERISLKDDVETKTHYSLDNHLMDLAEVEAKNAKFLKEMEERLSNFQVIKENEYKCERVISKEARRMICDCFLTADEEERGELGCGEDCLNRLLMIECGPDCNVKERCTNRRFQRFLCSPCRVFRTEKKGFGIMADIEILPGEFIMEYVGEVIDDDEFENRRTLYSQEKNRHYYFMALRSDAIIDATIKGNISRFINHSCDPNAETQKWTVNGELRIGFFSRKSIMPGEEITFDYQYQRYGRDAQRCYCESSNCRGWIGEEPNSDEGEAEQIDEDSDDEALTVGLLDDDDDEDDGDESDGSSGDAEAEKKLQLAAAEAKLFPLSGKSEAIRERGRRKAGTADDDEHDSKNKLKHLLNKVAEKVAKKKKEQKKQRQNEQKHRHGKEGGSAGASLRHLEDPDIEDEVNFLSRCGLKNQSDTLRLSRLMVRAKLPQTRLNLLQVLRRGELPCRRLFLDYHGLRLLHGWMSEDDSDMNMRLALLETLASLPIANKTVLTDTKVYHTVRSWCSESTATAANTTTSMAPTAAQPLDNEEVSKEISNAVTADVSVAVLEISAKLIATWESLPDIFRIPKRERIEQMKEHEREADRQYAAAADGEESTENSHRTSSSSSIDRYQRDRFGRMGSGSSIHRYSSKPYSKEARSISSMSSSSMLSDPRRRAGIEGCAVAALDSGARHLSKEQRREMFAAKVARDEAEKRLAEERRDFETKCRFFGLDPKKTRPHDMPFCVVPTTGQWYSADRHPIITPPSYAHVQVPVRAKSTNPNDYQLPALVAALPPNWRFAITPHGHIYYYHLQSRIPQWQPPSAADNNSESESDDDDGVRFLGDSSDDSINGDDELFISMDEAKLRAYIENKVTMRRLKRYKRLVSERGISPRREEDRIYNQMEVRKYKENKEKIRKRKEEIRRRRAEAQRAIAMGAVNEGADEDADDDDDKDAGGDTSKDVAIQQKTLLDAEEEEEQFAIAALPIQDYLLSSSDEGEVESIKEECNNSPLLEKIVQGDKIVDELDALAHNRPLKRPLLSHRDRDPLNSNSITDSSSSSGVTYPASAHELVKKRKLEKKEKTSSSSSSSIKSKSKEADAKYRKLKEKFRCEIAGIIVGNLKPYRKDTCQIGRIQSDSDFNHLAKKLTHFVMIKELKYCESVGQTLVVTESVKNKSREFIKKYMAKYGSVYEKPKNDPEFKDIPFL